MNMELRRNKVDLVGFYGSDEVHALSAWTSTSRVLTKDRKERVDKMLKMLAEAGHHTPFEKSYLHFIVECDTASHIHLLKHRIGVNVNGESARYKQIHSRHYMPDDWPDNWQEVLDAYAKTGENYYNQAVEMLEPALGRKRAKESARFFLPYANQIVLDVGFNFRSFMHFQGLRNKPDAQKEIKEIADDMLELVRDVKVFEHSLAGFGY